MSDVESAPIVGADGTGSVDAASTPSLRGSKKSLLKKGSGSSASAGDNSWMDAEPMPEAVGTFGDDKTAPNPDDKIAKMKKHLRALVPVYGILCAFTVLVTTPTFVCAYYRDTCPVFVKHNYYALIISILMFVGSAISITALKYYCKKPSLILEGALLFLFGCALAYIDTFCIVSLFWTNLFVALIAVALTLLLFMILCLFKVPLLIHPFVIGPIVIALAIIGYYLVPYITFTKDQWPFVIWYVAIMLFYMLAIHYVTPKETRTKSSLSITSDILTGCMSICLAVSDTCCCKGVCKNIFKRNRRRNNGSDEHGGKEEENED